MATAASKRVQDNTAAFELSFLESLQPALDDLARYGIRIAVNAGAADVEGLYAVVEGMVRERGLGLKVTS